MNHHTVFSYKIIITEAHLWAKGKYCKVWDIFKILLFALKDISLAIRDMDRLINKRTYSLDMCIYFIFILDSMQISCSYYVRYHFRKSSSTADPHNIFPHCYLQVAWFWSQFRHSHLKLSPWNCSPSPPLKSPPMLGWCALWSCGQKLVGFCSKAVYRTILVGRDPEDHGVQPQPESGTKPRP